MIKELIERLDVPSKGKILGKNVITELSLTFRNDDDLFNSDILNEAIYSYFLPECYSNITILVDHLKERDLAKLGFKNWDEALTHYKKDISLLARHWGVSVGQLKSDLGYNNPVVELISPQYGHKLQSLGAPHDYQKRLKTDIHSVNSGHSWSTIVTLPTGGGKTRVANEFIVDLFRLNSAFKICWVVGSKELIEQSISAFKEIWSEKGDCQVQLNRFYGNYSNLRANCSHSITYCGIDLLISKLNQSPVEAFLESVDLIVIDEAHLAGAPTYKQILSKYKDLSSTYRILGLTATPYRLEDVPIDFKDNFNYRVSLRDENNSEIESSLMYLIDNQYLSRVNFIALNVGNILSTVEGKQELNMAALESLKKVEENNQRCVVFAQSRAHAIALNIYFKYNGLRSALIIGATPDNQRFEILDKMRNKDLSILVNHQMLSAGLDIPGLESIMILSDINSPSLAMQILGRAMRGPKNGGNENNTVFVTSSNYKTFEDFQLLENIINT